jgi:hypothetical protein
MEKIDEKIVDEITMKFMGSSPAITSHRTTRPSFIHHLGLEAGSERQGDSPLLTWARLRLGWAAGLGVFKL